MSIRFNPFTNTFDFVGTGGSSSPDNFSYQRIETGETVTIPTNQEMIVDGPVTLDGTLVVDGVVTEQVDYSLWSFGWNTIQANVSIRIPTERDLLFCSPLIIDGVLTVDGRLIEVS